MLLRPSLVDDIDRELASRSLREFIRQAWSTVEPATEFVPGWHLDAICDHLEAVTRGGLRNLVINIPPRHMKSLAVAVFWPCWEWISWPERRWLFSSYAASLSIRDSLKCRRLIESPWYQANWGDRFQLTSDQNAKQRFENNKSGYRLATSVGGAATGEGGDRIVVDDPHNVGEAESDLVRRAALDWWDQVMSTRLNDPKTGAKVIVMQRVHEADLTGHVLEQGGYELLCLPAEWEEGSTRVTSIGWSDPRSRTGRVALAGALRTGGTGDVEAVDGELRRGRSAAAAAVAGRRRHPEAALVEVLETAGRGSPAGIGAIAGWAAADHPRGGSAV